MEMLYPILQIALLGFFAGAILNFMPCVLPLIAVKIAGFSNAKSKQEAKLLSIMTVIGILTFCLILAGIFATFSNLYWGFQLQFPSVISLLIFAFTILFAVVFGFIDINPKLQINQLKSKILEGFVSGFLIVIFSLSCVAPIVASAVSFSFSFKNPYIIFFCLFFMGIGLSLPYILSGFFGLKFNIKGGGIASKIIKGFSSISVVLTLFYLLTILKFQTSLIFTSFILIASLFFTFLIYRFQQFVYFIIGFVFVVISPFFYSSNEEVKFQASVPFSQDNLEKYLSSGYTVLLNVEASWCITCKTNNISAFNTKDFNTYITQNNVIHMKADLTVKNKEIEDFMKNFGGFGVPFYAVFAGREGDYKLLPVLLTSASLINEIEEFKNNYAYKRGK